MVRDKAVAWADVAGAGVGYDREMAEAGRRGLARVVA